MNLEKHTVYDKVAYWLKNRPVVVAVMILFVVVVGIGAFTDALSKIFSAFRGNKSPVGASAPAKPGPDQRAQTYIDHTLEQIASIYEGRTTLQAESLAREMYIGKIVRLSLVLSDVEIVGDQVMVEAGSSGRKIYGPGLRAFLEQRWRPHLSHLGEGAPVTIQGRISKINRADVVIIILEEAELVDIDAT